ARRAKICPRSAPTVPFLRRSLSVRNFPRNAMARPETAQNRFPKSFRSLRPPANRPPSLPDSAPLRSPSERLAGGPAPLRSVLIADRDASPVEWLVPQRLQDRHAIPTAIA